MAKTAFGYSANEVMQQLGNPPQPAQSYQPPAQRQHPGSQPPPAAARPNPGSQPPPVGYPQAAANAATMYVPGGGPPAAAPGYGQPAPSYGSAPAPGYGAPAPGYGNAPAPGYGAPAAGYSPPAAPAGGMGIHSPQVATPAPLPAIPQPYLGAQSGVARAGRPIEPWKDALRLMMFVWGGILLASFAAPVMTDPMAFHWDTIINAEGSAKIPALVWAGVGLLAIVFAAIPMATLPRGALAAVLGVAGLFVPMAVTAFPDWDKLLPFLGSLGLVSGLLVRQEYVESLVARILVTIGVVCWLVPWLIPQGGQIPLVGMIQILIDGANHMEIVIVGLAQIVLAVLCLLVWMPGPATAGAKIFAWIVILFPVAVFALGVLVEGDIGDMVSKTPGALLAWAPAVAYSVLFGYGLATVIGKQLE